MFVGSRRVCQIRSEHGFVNSEVACTTGLDDPVLTGTLRIARVGNLVVYITCIGL